MSGRRPTLPPDSGGYRAHLEEQVLGGLFRAAGAGDLVGSLRGEQFEVERHKRIIGAILDAQAATGDVRLETVKERLSGIDADYLDLIAADAPDDIDTLRQSLRVFAAIADLPRIRGHAGRVVEAKTYPDALAAAADLKEEVVGATTMPPAVRDPDDRPTVLAPGLYRHGEEVQEVSTADFSREVLACLPAGTLYRMDFVVGRIVGPPGAQRFVRMDEQLMRQVIDDHMRLVGMKRGGPAFCPCSRDWAGLVLAAAGASDRVQTLRTLAHYPVYCPGFRLAHPGWNEEGGVYYDPPPELLDLKPCPTNARAILKDLLVDFPFGDEASFDNFVGLMITLLLRPAIDGPVPLHFFAAPMPRTGKGKLINAALGEAVLGRSIAAMQIGRTEEEREKRITSLILAGTQVVHLDNIPVGEVLDSPALASLATAYPFYCGRVLGLSKTPALPNSLVVVLSGNAPKTTDEIAKRIVPIFLQPKDDHPEDRDDFVHAEIEQYARCQRPKVLAVLLGLVEGWKAAGMPTSSAGRSIGGFEAWSRVVGGVLSHAGFTNWLSNQRAWARDADEWTADAETLVLAWLERYDDKDISATAILKLVRHLEIFPDVLAKEPRGQVVSLARTVLAPLCGRPVAGWIVRRTTAGSNSTYRLEARSAGVPGDPGVSHPTARMCEDPGNGAHAQKGKGAGETPGTHETPTADPSADFEEGTL